MKPKHVWFQIQFLSLTAVVMALGFAGTAWGQGKMGGAEMGKAPAMKMPAAQGDPIKMMTMMKEMAARVPRFPPVRGLGDGGVVFFIHTETSDPKISEVMTLMMGSPVITVPELAQAPQVMLGNVYVFKNGIRGMGPLGFQLDIFDNLPGSDGYRPLRRIGFVTWKNESSARELRSAAELMDAMSKGQLTVQRTGVVVNMPMLLWPMGRR